MKAEYKNVARSKALIRKAVITLLSEKKDLNLITVSDIVNEANINRGTFYNHYNNLSDVVHEIEDQLTLQLISSWVEVKNEENSLEAFIKSISNSLKQKESEYKAIIAYIPKYVHDDFKARIVREIGESFLPQSDIDKELRAEIYIIANGIAGVYIDYFSGKLNFTLDELAQYSSEIVKKIVPPELVDKLNKKE
jgi:AcrR family transcriptional regulator